MTAYHRERTSQPSPSPWTVTWTARSGDREVSLSTSWRLTTSQVVSLELRPPIPILRYSNDFIHLFRPILGSCYFDVSNLEYIFLTRYIPFCISGATQSDSLLNSRQCSCTRIFCDWQRNWWNFPKKGYSVGTDFVESLQGMSPYSILAYFRLFASCMLDK